jgi:hypothetical protein
VLGLRRWFWDGRNRYPKRNRSSPQVRLLVVVQSDLANRLLAGVWQSDDDLAVGMAGDAASELLIGDFQRLAAMRVQLDWPVIDRDD